MIAFIDYANTSLPSTGSTKGRCPKCNGSIEIGFGLAGGGYGVYEYCEACGAVVTKDVEPDTPDREP